MVAGGAVGPGVTGVGVGVALGVSAGGAVMLVSSFAPIATAVPTPTSTSAVPAAAIVCTRFQTNPAMWSGVLFGVRAQLTPDRP